MVVNDISQEQTYNAPAEIFGSNYAELKQFYQYYLPPERLSPQSWKINQKLTSTQLYELFQRVKHK